MRQCNAGDLPQWGYTKRKGETALITSSEKDLFYLDLRSFLSPPVSFVYNLHPAWEWQISLRLFGRTVMVGCTSKSEFLGRPNKESYLSSRVKDSLSNRLELHSKPTNMLMILHHLAYLSMCENLGVEHQSDLSFTESDINVTRYNFFSHN